MGFAIEVLLSNIGSVWLGFRVYGLGCVFLSILYSLCDKRFGVHGFTHRQSTET